MILKHNLSLPSAATIATHSSIQSHKLVLLHKMEEEDENNKIKEKIIEKQDKDGRIDEKPKGKKQDKDGRVEKNKNRTEGKGAEGK